jgi:hypothetical protein
MDSLKMMIKYTLHNNVRPGLDSGFNACLNYRVALKYALGTTSNYQISKLTPPLLIVTLNNQKE